MHLPFESHSQYPHLQLRKVSNCYVLRFEWAHKKEFSCFRHLCIGILEGKYPCHVSIKGYFGEAINQDAISNHEQKDF